MLAVKRLFEALIALMPIMQPIGHFRLFVVVMTGDTAPVPFSSIGAGQPFSSSGARAFSGSGVGLNISASTGALGNGIQ